VKRTYLTSNTVCECVGANIVVLWGGRGLVGGPDKIHITWMCSNICRIVASLSDGEAEVEVVGEEVL